MEKIDEHPIARLTNVLAFTIVLLLTMLSLIGGFVLVRLDVTIKDILTAVRDIETKVERGRSESQALLSVLEKSGVATIVLDNTGIIRFWSDGAEELFGVTDEYALGFKPNFMIPPNLKDRHHKSFAKAMSNTSEGPFHQTIECAAHHSDGHTIHLTADIWAVPEHSAIAIFTPKSIDKNLINMK